MKLTILFACLAALLFMIGCSDESKEEAERLEQELLGDTGTIDTTPADTTPLEEPLGEETMADAEAVPEEGTYDLPSQPLGSGYVVQVASCQSNSYAAHLVSLYEGRGYEPFVTQFDHDGQLYYRVRLGPFETHADALAVKKELQNKYSVTSWIALTE